MTDEKNHGVVLSKKAREFLVVGITAISIGCVVVVVASIYRWWGGIILGSAVCVMGVSFLRLYAVHRSVISKLKKKQRRTRTSE